MLTTLLICEKPDASKRIAQALSEETPKKLFKRGMPYYVGKIGNERLIVCPSLGHLYTVSSRKTRNRNYPVLDITWKPRYMVERGQNRIQSWIQAINELSKEADRFVNATDYDLEGSLIGYMILRYACEGAESKAKRMVFSTLTMHDLRSAYSNLSVNLDFNLIYAGMCRHEIDWLYGINLSRVLTVSANRIGGEYLILSIGRVQGPTLKFVVEREKEIKKFIPRPFWTIETEFDFNGKKISAYYEKRRLSAVKDGKRVLDDCRGKTGIITDVKITEVRMRPLPPFDISTLQTEAYHFFGFTPRESLAIAEKLYLNALISYPRTSSQKLPTSIGYREI